MPFPSSWTFGSPWRLLLLLGVVLLLAAYVWMQRRRTAFETRFTQVDLLASVVPRGTAWRRHLPVGLLVGTLVVLTTAFARPSASVTVPRDKATVIVALDTSTSMRAEDITPTRFAAAQAAAKGFIDGLPASFSVGLVSFNYTTQVVAPTTDHAAIDDAIDGLTLKDGTVIGNAVEAAVKAAKEMPVTAGEQPAPVTIVLLSDGISAGGAAVSDAAQVAADAKYPVTTIAYGSDSPTVKVGDKQVALPVDTAALAGLATTTGGKAYRALTGQQLRQIYADITARAGSRKDTRELASGLLGVGLVGAMAASAASLIWFRALP